MSTVLCEMNKRRLILPGWCVKSYSLELGPLGGTGIQEGKWEKGVTDKGNKVGRC